MVKLLDPTWTERASLSLNKQMRKEDLPHPSLDMDWWGHIMGFSIPAINLPFCDLREIKKEREREREVREERGVIRKLPWKKLVWLWLNMSRKRGVLRISGCRLLSPHPSRSVPQRSGWSSWAGSLPIGLGLQHQRHQQQQSQGRTESRYQVSSEHSTLRADAEKKCSHSSVTSVYRLRITS